MAIDCLQKGMSCRNARAAGIYEVAYRKNSSNQHDDRQEPIWLNPRRIDDVLRFHRGCVNWTLHSIVPNAVAQTYLERPEAQTQCQNGGDQVCFISCAVCFSRFLTRQTVPPRPAGCAEALQ